MIEEFEYDGIWCLPEKPDNKVSGKLKFHPVEGLKLQLGVHPNLYRITQKLKTILQICLLHELGFDKEEIKSAFLRNRRYKDDFV